MVSACHKKQVPVSKHFALRPQKRGGLSGTGGGGWEEDERVSGSTARTTKMLRHKNVNNKNKQQKC